MLTYNAWFYYFPTTSDQGGSWKRVRTLNRPPCFLDGRDWTEYWQQQWWTWCLESQSRLDLKSSTEHRLDASYCIDLLKYQKHFLSTPSKLFMLRIFKHQTVHQLLKFSQTICIQTLTLLALKLCLDWSSSWLWHRKFQAHVCCSSKTKMLDCL